MDEKHTNIMILGVVGIVAIMGLALVITARANTGQAYLLPADTELGPIDLGANDVGTEPVCGDGVCDIEEVSACDIDCGTSSGGGGEGIEPIKYIDPTQCKQMTVEESWDTIPYMIKFECPPMDGKQAVIGDISVVRCSPGTKVVDVGFSYSGDYETGMNTLPDMKLFTCKGGDNLDPYTVGTNYRPAYVKGFCCPIQGTSVDAAGSPTETSTMHTVIMDENGEMVEQ